MLCNIKDINIFETVDLLIGSKFVETVVDLTTSKTNEID